MSTFYEDNMNIKKINGFTLQQVSRDVWAIDEFGIDIMYLIIGTERALLIDTGIGIGNIRSVVETMTHLPYDVVNTHHHYDLVCFAVETADRTWFVGLQRRKEKSISIIIVPHINEKRDAVLITSAI